MRLDGLDAGLDLGDVLDVFVHEGLVVFARFMQAVDQRAQLALRLGQAGLRVDEVQLVLALVGQVQRGLLGHVHKLEALFLDLVNIQFKRHK